MCCILEITTNEVNLYSWINEQNIFRNKYRLQSSVTLKYINHFTSKNKVDCLFFHSKLTADNFHEIRYCTHFYQFSCQVQWNYKNLPIRFLYYMWHIHFHKVLTWSNCGFKFDRNSHLCEVLLHIEGSLGRGVTYFYKTVKAGISWVLTLYLIPSQESYIY